MGERWNKLGRWVFAVVLGRTEQQPVSTLRAGMMASRLYRRRHIIPAQTDHLVVSAG
jgi:hypothetical protein